MREALTADSHRGDRAASELAALLSSLSLGQQHAGPMEATSGTHAVPVADSSDSIVADAAKALSEAEGPTVRCARCGGWVSALRLEAHDRYWCPAASSR